MVVLVDPERARPFAYGSLAAATTDALHFGLARVSWMAIVRPFFPSYVHLFNEESVLCPLHSHRSGELSIMAPAVGHKFLVPGQKRSDLLEFRRGKAPSARDMPLNKGLPAKRIQKNEIELARVDRLEHIRALLLGLKFVDEVLLVGANLVRCKAHAQSLSKCAQITESGKDPGFNHAEA